MGSNTIRRTFLKSKLHRAKVTEANIEYEGSITIDTELMKAADLLPFERVEIYNINNGARFATYVIEGPANSGEICINGAAARHAGRNDLVIICSYVDVEDDGTSKPCFDPKIVLLDENNRPKRKLSR